MVWFRVLGPLTCFVLTWTTWLTPPSVAIWRDSSTILVRWVLNEWKICIRSAIYCVFFSQIVMQKSSRLTVPAKLLSTQNNPSLLGKKLPTTINSQLRIKRSGLLGFVTFAPFINVFHCRCLCGSKSCRKYLN